MAENREPVEPIELGHPEPHHEVADVNAWAVGKFAIALVLLAIVSLGGLFALFRYFIQAEGGPATPVTRGSEVDARRRPPAPQLEITEALDLARQREAEDKLLTSYGWIDQSAGSVRMPIDRAMDVLAQRGLPSRAQPATPLSTATLPTESGLGEIVQQPGGPLGSSK